MRGESAAQPDPPSSSETARLREEVRWQVRQAFPPTMPAERLIVLGGTGRALARIHLAAEPDGRSRHGLRLRRAAVGVIRERLVEVPVASRRRVRGLKAERADTIVAGTLVLEELMSLLGPDTDLTVRTRGVRDGFLWSEVFGGQAWGKPAARALA